MWSLVIIDIQAMQVIDMYIGIFEYFLQVW